MNSSPPDSPPTDQLFLLKALDVPLTSFLFPSPELRSLIAFSHTHNRLDPYIQNHGSVFHAPFGDLGGWVCDRCPYALQQAYCPSHLRINHQVGGCLCMLIDPSSTCESVLTDKFVTLRMLRVVANNATP
jgi:hypothetical protein